MPCVVRHVELFHAIPAILDRARELHFIQAIAHSDSTRLAIGLGGGLRVAQLAELRAAAEIPALFRHEVDSGGVREAGQRPAVLVTVIDVDAGAVGEPSLLPPDKVAAADTLAVV